MALGACRHLITLDYLISRHSQRHIRRIDPIVLQIIRIGLYQLIFLSGTADFAAVHQAVEQVRMAKIQGAEAFVNAVLRSIQRDIDSPVTNQDATRPRATLWFDTETGIQFKTDFLPNPAKNPVKFYSLAFAHPPWLIDHWLKLFPEETVRQICLADNSRPPLTLRVNRLHCTPEELMAKLSAENIKAEPSGYAIQLLQPAIPEQLPGYQQGLFSIQDVTAMSATENLKPQSGQRILDLCAAPGGKTTHLAEIMANTGSILACDINTQKLDLISQNCSRLRINIVKTCLPDNLQENIERDGLFDAVLLDAPCSNTGVLARRPEARHRIKPVAIQRLAQTQMTLLKQAADAVKKNGNILYSTCSIDHRENELLVRKFLQEKRNFRLLQEKLTLPCSYHGKPKTTDIIDAEPLSRHDGGYLAIFERL